MEKGALVGCACKEGSVCEGGGEEGGAKRANNIYTGALPFYPPPRGGGAHHPPLPPAPSPPTLPRTIFLTARGPPHCEYSSTEHPNFQSLFLWSSTADTPVRINVEEKPAVGEDSDTLATRLLSMCAVSTGARLGPLSGA